MAINPNEINIKNIIELIQSSSIQDNDLLVIGQGIYARKSTVLELYNKFGVPSILTSLNSLQLQINQLNNTLGNSVLYSPQVKTPIQKFNARNNLEVYSRFETQTVVNSAIANLGNVVNSVNGVNVDNTDPKNPIVAEFRPIADYNNDMLNKADIDGNLTTGGIWWQDQVLSDRFANYKQVWTALTNNTIEWGNIELDKHIFLIDDANGLKIKVGLTEGTIWNTFNLTNVSQLNNDAGYLQANDLDGFIYDVQYNSATHTITFYQQNEPNIVIDLPIEQLIKGVQLVGNDLVFTFEDGSTVTVPLNTLLVGVVKSVNGLTPNSQGEIILNVTDIPNLSSELANKLDIRMAGLVNNLTQTEKDAILTKLGIVNNIVQVLGLSGNTITLSNGGGSISLNIANIGGLQTELNKIGNLPSLTTTNKNNLVDAINEVNGNIPNVTGFVPYMNNSGGGLFATSIYSNYFGVISYDAGSSVVLDTNSTQLVNAHFEFTFVFAGNTKNRILIGFDNNSTSSTSNLKAWCSNPDEVLSVSVGRRTADNNQLSIIVTFKNSLSRPHFSVNSFNSPHLHTGGLIWSSRIISDLSEFTLVTSQNSEFIRDSYYLDYNNFTNKPTIPTSSDYITTNTNQTGLSGNKTTSGTWTFNSQINTANHGNSSEWKQAYDWGKGLRVDGNGTPVLNMLGDAFAVRNASVWATSLNRPGGINSSVVNFTAYNSGGATYGFSLGARNNKLYFVTEENSVIGNWLELYHTGNFNPAQYVLQSALNTQLSNYVPINGVTTINNTKTFTSSPVVPNATLNSHAVNLGQLNSALDGYIPVIPLMSNTVVGGAKLYSNTLQNYPVQTDTYRSNRTYAIQLNDNGELVVNVPWNNTVYAAGTIGALEQGTSTADRVWSASILHEYINNNSVTAEPDILFSTDFNTADVVTLNNPTVFYFTSFVDQLDFQVGDIKRSSELVIHNTSSSDVEIKIQHIKQNGYTGDNFFVLRNNKSVSFVLAYISGDPYFAIKHVTDINM